MTWKVVAAVAAAGLPLLPLKVVVVVAAAADPLQTLAEEAVVAGLHPWKAVAAVAVVDLLEGPKWV